ncbi:MAG: hypothetical protein AAF845_17995 [Bacteroidota bacterium]
MTYPTTSLILARKALGMPAGRACVDWAVGRLVAGHEGEAVAMLASEVPPFNAFEIADLRDRALAEVEAPDLSGPEAVRAYAAERLRLALDGEADLLEALREVRDLCVRHDYYEAVYDVYLLSYAYDDLLSAGHTYYWPDVTLDTFPEVLREVVDRLGD